LQQQLAKALPTNSLHTLDTSYIDNTHAWQAAELPLHPPAYTETYTARQGGDRDNGEGDTNRYSFGHGAHLPSSFWNDTDDAVCSKGGGSGGMGGGGGEGGDAGRAGGGHLEDGGLNALFPWMQEAGALSLPSGTSSSSAAKYRTSAAQYDSSRLDCYEEPRDSYDFPRTTTTTTKSYDLPRNGPFASPLGGGGGGGAFGMDTADWSGGAQRGAGAEAEGRGRGRGGLLISQCAHCGEQGMVLDGGLCPQCWQTHRIQSRYVHQTGDLPGASSSITSSSTSTSTSVLPVPLMGESGDVMSNNMSRLRFRPRTSRCERESEGEREERVRAHTLYVHTYTNSMSRLPLPWSHL
jgi:hypothetical protein